MEPLSWTGSIAFLNPLLMIALAVLTTVASGSTVVVLSGVAVNAVESALSPLASVYLIQNQ